MINLPHIGLYGDFESCQKNIMTFLNRNFSVIDSLMQAKVKSFVSVLPENPDEGDLYILQGFSYSSEYNEDALMLWDGKIWIEVEAQKGMIVYVESENNIFWYNGTDWLLLPIFSDSASFSNVTVETLSFIESENTQDTPDLTSPETAVINLTGDLDTIDSIQAPDPDKSGIYIYKNHTGNSVKVLNSATVRTGTGKDLDFKDGSAIITLYSSVDGQYIILGGSGSGSGTGLIVADLAERDAIPADDRIESMTVTVTDDGFGVPRDYQLVGGIDNANWVIKTRNMFGHVSLSISTFAGGEIAAESFEANHTYVNVTCTTNTSILALPETISRDKKISVRSDSASTGRFFVSGASLLGYGTEPTLSLEPNELLHFDYVKAIDKWILSGRVL